MISIIVPFYNVERYLDECIQSIVNQTFTDWELILVDDGSTDSSSAIARQWEARDNRITCIPKANGGVSSARNTGLDNAKGEYVMFVDSDDICHPGLLYWFDILAGSEADIVVCKMARFVSAPAIGDVSFDPKFWVGLNDIYVELVNNTLLHAPSAKLYRRSIIDKNKIRFRIGLHLGEDVIFNLNYLKYASSAAYIDTPMYFYRDTPDSLSKNIQCDYAKIQLEILTEKINFISIHKIKYDFKPVAPGIVRDIALTTLKSTASKQEKIESLERLKHHRIMDYCSQEGKMSDILFAQFIKWTRSEIIVNIIK